jgi:hypothetical protein
MSEKKRQLNTGKASAWAVGARSNLCGYDWDWSLSGLELGFSRRRKLILISLARRPRADFGYSRFLIKLSAETFHCRPKQSAYRVAQHLPIGVYAFFQRLNPHSSEALLIYFSGIWSRTEFVGKGEAETNKQSVNLITSWQESGSRLLLFLVNTIALFIK